MIVRKQKVCKECKIPKFIFSKGLCAYCYGIINGKKIKISKTPSQKSPKQAQRLTKYSLLREEYLQKHPICEVCSTEPSTEIHHKKSRIGENLFQHFLAVDISCHQFIHANPQWAKEKGFLL